MNPIAASATNSPAVVIDIVSAVFGMVLLGCAGLAALAMASAAHRFLHRKDR
jgi:hypothetical protein